MSSSLQVNGQDDRWLTNEPKISEVCDNDGGSTKEKRKKKGGGDTTQCRWVLPIDFLLTPAECAGIWSEFSKRNNGRSGVLKRKTIKIRKNTQKKIQWFRCLKKYSSLSKRFPGT
jgi:hypothetical protein